MCDILTIAGIAATAGSAAVNSMAQSKIQNARDDALAAERVRQKGLDAEAAALNTQSQDRYRNIEGQREGKAQELGDYFAGQSIDANTASQEVNVPPPSNNVIVRENEKQQAKAKEFTGRQGQALGDLRSFGDLLGGISREQARDATEIGTIGGFKRGSSSIVPYELEEANTAGDGLKLFGDILGLGGSVATSAGLSGGSFGTFGKTAAKPVAVAAPKVDPWVGLRDPWSGLRSIYGR